MILKNTATEGPGTIEDYLAQNGISYKIVGLEKEGIPDPKSFGALVMMGGPMSVNDDISYIRREEELVREFISGGKKVFGVCLGAQIMAKALGSRVYAGPQKEIGWYDIELTEDGMNDPLMKRLALHPKTGEAFKKIDVFHWHGETFDIPKGCVRLAGSALYPNQAFRYGQKAYAFQFHIEVRKEMIYDWLKNEPVDLEKLRTETEANYGNYSFRASNFYKAFFE